MTEQQPEDPKLVLMAEPLSPMLAIAQEAQKMLSTYISVGFTRAEAFDIVLNQIPEWTFPGQTVIQQEEYVDDEDDDLWEDVPDEMTEEDD